MAAQAAAKSCRLGALIGNSWRRTLHSSPSRQHRGLCSGSGRRQPAKISTYRKIFFHLSQKCNGAALRHRFDTHGSKSKSSRATPPPPLSPPQPPGILNKRDGFATREGGGFALVFCWGFFWRGWGSRNMQLKERFRPPCSYSAYQKLCLKRLASLRVSAHTHSGTYVLVMHTHP